MSEAAYYDQAKLWDAERYLVDEDQRRRLELTADILPPDVGSILDVGAGNGAFLSVLESRNSQITLQGIERSQTAIHRSVCSAPITCASADALPFDDETFEAVCALEVIEHLPHLIFETAIREMERVARRYIVISVPYRERRWKVTCPYCATAFHPYMHLRSFDKHRMRYLFETFELERTEFGMAEIPVFPTSLMLALRNMRGRDSILPRFVVCPVCNYSSSHASESGQNESSLVHLLKAAKAGWPKRQQPNWIIALYRRGMKLGSTNACCG